MLQFLKRKLGRRDTWSIVATVREPLALLQAFTAHHLDAGAEKIYLFFDDPLDTSYHYFSGIDRVEAVCCSADHWKKLTGKRSVDHRQRQAANAQLAYEKCTSDWITHIDADEFLVTDNDIARVIGQFSRKTASLRVLPIERTFARTYDDNALAFDGYFKLGSSKGAVGPALFGDIGEHFNRGFQGHDVGKSFVRTGAKGRKLRIHYAWENGERVKPTVIDSKQMLLAHFFPQSFEDWQHKYRRRTEIRRNFKVLKKGRKEKFSLYQTALKADGIQGVRDLFNRLSVLDDRQIALLESQNLLHKKQFDLDRKTAQYLPASVSATMPEFIHVSINRSSPRPTGAARFFQIGMPYCGTKDLCRQFAIRGFNTAHSDSGKLAQNILANSETGSPLLDSYSEIDMFAGLFGKTPEGILIHAQTHFANLDTAFPEAIFLLNRVSFTAWLTSLSRFDDGALLTLTRSEQNLTTDDQVREYWISCWQEHRNAVVAHFSDRPEKLIEFSIDKVKPGHVFEELEARGQLWEPK